jgi:hypothetical protein
LDSDLIQGSVGTTKSTSTVMRRGNFESEEDEIERISRGDDESNQDSLMRRASQDSRFNRMNSGMSQGSVKSSNTEMLKEDYVDDEDEIERIERRGSVGTVKS